ncbi:hypothetical protein ES708_16820 [subsurface metagenome]
MAPHQIIEKLKVTEHKNPDLEFMYEPNDLQRLLDNLSREISQLEQENTSLKSTVEKLIPEGTSGQAAGKAINLSKGITTEKQLKLLLHENRQLKSRLLIYKLTTKEKQVLKLIASGLTNKEIAKKLGRSSHTITTHRKKLLSKLKFKNTAAMVTFAARN